MNEKLAEALGHVDEQYITQAAKRKKRKKRLLTAVAAVLALVILFNGPAIPMVVSAKTVAAASDSRAPQWHGSDSLRNSHDSYDAYNVANSANQEQVQAGLTNMRPFLKNASNQFLTNSEENTVWSPINAAIALSILAETADGTTRQEVLDLLGVGDVETLRRYIAALWETCYSDDGHEVSTLANSLWLDDSMKYDQSVMDTLAYDYYASVYQGDLGSGRSNRAIQTWVNNQTGGFLQKMSNGIDVSTLAPAIDTALALVSTVYVRGNWDHEFSKGMNTAGAFHASGGDVEATYMNKKEAHMYYYWAESFGAVRMGLKNDTSMWLMLPDEGKTPADVLADEAYLQMLGNIYQYENSEYLKVNLSVPKFDISANLDLKDGLQQMGLTEVFDENGGDFGTTFQTDLPIYVNRVNQATRVAIDEEGMTAASYIVLGWGVGAAAPPEDIIDFVLDRPFVFVIATEGIPMFVGVVNEP